MSKILKKSQVLREGYVRGLKKAQRVISRMLKENAGGDYEELNEQLIDAARDGDYEAVESLLNAGVDVDAKDNDGWTALMWAAGLGRERIVRLLLNAGADVNAKNKYGSTALMSAAEFGEFGNEDCIERLLNAGADVNAKSKDGHTALMAAAYYGHEDIARLLLDAGADVDAKEKDGKTALSQAENKNIVKLLRQYGAEED